MIRYALYNKKTGHYLGFSTSDNPDDGECVPVMFELEDSKYEGSVWMVNTYEKANDVRLHSTVWYNAEYSKPRHNFLSVNLEVRKLEFPD